MTDKEQDIANENERHAKRLQKIAADEERAKKDRANEEARHAKLLANIEFKYAPPPEPTE